ncbi:glycosyltransferase family 2 protein [Calditrichota bacterium]
MRIGGVISVRDEEQLVELNLRYHLDVQGFDTILIIDNGSTDNTFRILTEMNDSRVIIKRTTPETGLAQDVVSTIGTKELFDIYGCDWVIPIDGDEFWVSSTLGTIRNALEQVPENIDILMTRSYRFYPTVLDDASLDHFLLRLRYAKYESFGDVEHKVIMRRLSDRLESLPIGNHWANLKKGATAVTADVRIEDISRFHYRYLDEQSFKKRVISYSKGCIQRFGRDWELGKRSESRRIYEWYVDILDGKFEEKFRKSFVLDEQYVKTQISRGEMVYLDDMTRLFPQLESVEMSM